MSAEEARDASNRTDDVQETVHYRQLGVKVEKVVRSGYQEDQPLTKVYRRKKMGRFKRLDGDGTEEVVRWVKLAEVEPQDATALLFGLAEAHGYDLEAK